ncbi:uncharacterized protein METZ01_LOCUS433917 [marine metagenome]|uniref:Uncharacterized protein n=1 Tax=marine metagenome TaxID=408172 RepID=A0A382YCR0_9ZZZZ
MSSVNKHCRRNYTKRRHIGEILAEDGGWMTAAQIVDRASANRRMRKLLDTRNSVSMLLRGTQGLDIIPWRSGVPQQYRMRDWDLFLDYIRGPKFRADEWHGNV